LFVVLNVVLGLVHFLFLFIYYIFIMCSKRFQCERSGPIGVDFKKSQGEDMCKAMTSWKLTSFKIMISF